MIKTLYETCIKDRWGLGFIPFIGITLYGSSLPNSRDKENYLKDEGKIVQARKDMEAILDERGLEDYSVSVVREQHVSPLGYLIAGSGVVGMGVYSFFIIPGFLRKRTKEEPQGKA